MKAHRSATRPTLAWTEAHAAAVVALVALAVSVALTSAAAGGWFPVVGVLVVLVIALVALLTSGMVGIVAATAGSAGLVQLLAMSPSWGPEMFWSAVGVVVSLLALGWAAGWLGSALRARIPVAPVGPSTVEPDSVGILTAQAGRLRLAEEVQRARLGGTPLVLAGFQIRAAQEGAELHPGAFRAVVRAVDSRLRPIDVPFADGPGSMLAILPGSTAGEALEVLADVLGGVEEATFADRESGQRRSLREVAVVRIGIAELGDDADADLLCASARPEVLA